MSRKNISCSECGLDHTNLQIIEQLDKSPKGRGRAAAKAAQSRAPTTKWEYQCPITGGIVELNLGQYNALTDSIPADRRGNKGA